ncbi:Transposase IS110 family [Flavobacterium limnosediminis JC2902]|uniref:Transposase IS110 family n=1 Tax=Flavobacterium limnosediminis JC2902 TaxID=1341181 RepID=V6STQ4_9FLAO|nr:IS110 family transposase [Flavobacterium limnosediminis]ESU30021.1 Transposase IS110 family [Flavobacterium limnosediminis JC2902]
MARNKKIFGIDISKDTFDVVDSMGNYNLFSNNMIGFLKFFELLDSRSHCVMEATGYYHYPLACFLTEKHIAVSVENPLSVKRYVQMKLSRIKTDKSDAKMICLYGQERELSLWKRYSKNQLQCLQLISLLETYAKQSTSLKNKLEDQLTLGSPSQSAVKSLKRSLMNLQQETAIIEAEALALVESEHRQMLTKLESIPGVGRKTALTLIVLTNGFKRFKSSSQLCSFTGLTPVIRQSGSSIKGKNRISKIGNGRLRNLLFMCSFSACKSNRACRELYERIVNKGKSKKLALIAVCNKLLKQAFAIAKSGVAYNENYGSTVTVNQ